VTLPTHPHLDHVKIASCVYPAIYGSWSTGLLEEEAAEAVAAAIAALRLAAS
jgi:hypothetical protein